MSKARPTPPPSAHPLLLRAVPEAQQLIRDEHFSLENLCHALDCSLRELGDAVGSIDELMAHVNHHFMAGYIDLAHRVEHLSDTEAVVQLSQLWLDYALAHPQEMKVLLQYRWGQGFERPDWYMARVAECFTPIEGRLRGLAPKASAEEITLVSRGIYAQVSGLYFLAMNERATPAGIASRQKVLETCVRWVLKGLIQG